MCNAMRDTKGEKKETVGLAPRKQNQGWIKTFAQHCTICK